MSKCKNPHMAGLFMMFPAVTLLGYYFVSGNVTPTELKSITLISLVSLVTVIVFIVSFYFLQSKFNIGFALTGSLLCWCISASAIVYIKSSC